MKSRIYVKVQRPRESDLSKRGILARLSDEHFEWLGKVIRKYQSEELLREMIEKGAPNLTGVKICDKKDDIVALIEVTKEMEGVYRLEYYKKD